MRFVDVADESCMMEHNIAGDKSKGNDGRLSPTAWSSYCDFVFRSVDQIEDLPMHIAGEWQGESVWKESLRGDLRGGRTSA